MVFPIGSLSSTSSLSVAGTSKDLLKDAAGTPPAISTTEVYPVDGYVVPSAISNNNELNVNADFYRNGGVDLDDPEITYPARQISPHSLAKEAEGGKAEASIRIRGIKTGGDNNKGKVTEEVDYIPSFTKFILENVQENYNERYQVVETFGDYYAFFYGQRPSVFNMSGTLINTRNVNWLQDFMFMYDNFLRGTRCVERRARAIITYGGRQIEGFIVNTGNQTAAATEEGVPFSFQFLVTQRNFLGFSDDFGLSEGPGGSFTKDSTLESIVNSLAGDEGTGESNPETGDAKNAAKDAMGGKPPANAKAAAAIATTAPVAT